MIPILAFSQKEAKVSGYVIARESNKPLANSSIILQPGENKTKTDFSGYFEFQTVDTGNYSLLAKNGIQKPKFITDLKVGLENSKIQYIILRNINIISDLDINDTVDSDLENNFAQNNFRKNSISETEEINSSGKSAFSDINAAETARRLNQFLIQNNQSALIRGMNERYTTYNLNGFSYPAINFKRQGFAFATYSTDFIDNIRVIKTFSPEYKSEFGSGVVEINTIKIPAKNFTTLAIQGSLVPKTTTKDFLYNCESDNDILGIDKDDSRSLPSNFPNTQSFVDSVNSFNPIGERGTDQFRKLNDNWATKSKTASPDLNLQLTSGTVFKSGKNAFGLIIGLTYLNANNFSENTRQNYTNDTLKRDSVTKSLYSNQIDWTGAINLGYKIGNHSIISFRNQFGVNTIDQTRISDGSLFLSKIKTNVINNREYQYFTHQTLNSQLDGEHQIRIKNYKFGFNWSTNFNDVSRNAPDNRLIQSSKDTTSFDFDGNPIIPKFKVNPRATRNFSKSFENVSSGKFSFRLPINFINFKNELSFGGFSEERNVVFTARNFFYEPNIDNITDSLLNLPIDSIFLNANLNPFRFYGNESLATNAYQAGTKITAFHASLENNITNYIRLNYGFRFEKFEQNFNLINAKDSLDTTKMLFGDTSYNRFFPSFNVQINLNNRETLRFSFSRTINRPEFNELSPLGLYDFNTGFTTFGNPNLRPAIINSYDFRYELYTKNGDNFTLGAFYKRINDAIELIQYKNNLNAAEIPLLIWVNAPEAKTYGLELSANRNLRFIDKAFGSNFFSNFSAYTALLISKSAVNYSGTSGITGQGFELKPMNGSSPILVNAGLVYDCHPLGLNAGFVYNYSSKKLLFVSNQNNGETFQNAQNFLDIHVAKDIGRLNIRLAVQNLFAKNSYMYRNDLKDFNSDGYQSKDRIVQTFRTTPIYSLRLAFRFY